MAGWLFLSLFLIVGFCHNLEAVLIQEIGVGDPSALGTGVYLPDVNILDTVQGARTIFSSDITGAVSTIDYPVTKISTQFYKSTASFYSYIAENAGLSGGISTVSFSLQQTFSMISGGNTDISSLAINAVAFSKMSSILNDQIANIPLNPNLLKDLDVLPGTINATWQGTSWSAIGQFMRKWGSHYVTNVYTGSWLQQWSVANSSKSYSAKNFTAQACLKLEGPIPPVLDPCASVSLQDKRDASSYEMNDILYVKGGKSSTRANLTQHRTQELVQQFLDEGSDPNAPAIQYKFAPIWEIIRQRFPVGSQQWQVARNLEAYYVGLKGFGCSFKQTSNGKFLQHFRGMKDDLGTYYECVRLCQGCTSNADCHIGGAFATQCFCYGKGCIALDKNNHPIVRSSAANDDINLSCQYQVGVWCQCTPNWEDGCPSDGYIVQWSQHALASPRIMYT